MKAVITVERIVEYSTIIEIEKTDFDSLVKSLESGGKECRDAERWLNAKINVKDWQHEEFKELVSFEEFRP